MSVLAPVKPYFTYAAQMRNSVPVMSYHCKLYAVQKGLDLTKGKDSEQAKAAQSYLMEELGDLETLKQAMGNLDKEDMKVNLENFVLSVFAAADKDERTCETVGKPQAIGFKRAGDFIVVLTLVSEGNQLLPEWEDRRKYCMYKAGTILKALKAGEVPVRGNPFEEQKPEEAQVPQFDPQTAQQNYVPQDNYQLVAPAEQQNYFQNQSVQPVPVPIVEQMPEPMQANTFQYQPQPDPFQSQQQQPYQPQPEPFQTQAQAVVQPQQQYQTQAQSQQLGPIAQTPLARDSKYYKAIQAAKKALTQAGKALLIKHIDEMIQSVREAYLLLEPYCTSRQQLQQNGGMNKQVSRFSQDLACVQKNLEDAQGELDFSNIDTAYANIFTAMNYLAPYGSN